MKVAILTQPLGRNYGGILQAYALQAYLRGIGCEVETLDRRAPTDITLSIKDYFLNLIRLVLGRIKTIPTARKYDFIFKNLSDFRDQALVMSPRISSEKMIRDYFRENSFDAVIVGSDQVWRPRYSPSILNFYLDFLGDIKSSSKRLAYAASFGVDEWEYTCELTEKCRELAQQFSAISVRESSAVDLCKKKLNVSAAWVADPTLLLKPADYELLIEGCGQKNKDGRVLSYVLDPTPRKHSIANIVGNALSVGVFTIKPELSVSQVRAKHIDQCRFPSVESWLQSFRDASFVVTDSFHGTVFSILFNKPFISIGNSDRGLARFESLLSQFGLLKRLVKDQSEVTSDLIYAEIDWELVNDKRSALAEEGRKFIKNHLFGK